MSSRSNAKQTILVMSGKGGVGECVVAAKAIDVRISIEQSDLFLCLCVVSVRACCVRVNNRQVDDRSALGACISRSRQKGVLLFFLCESVTMWLFIECS